MEVTKSKPLDAFGYVLRVLKYTGYFKPVPEQKTNYHKIYRGFTFAVIVLYDLQHAVFVYKAFGDLDKMMEGMIILFNMANVAYKFASVTLNFNRFDRLNDVLKSDIFQATCKQDEEFMNENRAHINRLSKTITAVVPICCTFWFTSPIIKKINLGDVVEHPAYFPFDTTDWVGFVVASAYLTLVIGWAGYGDLTLDCLIVGYYSQAKVQLSIIRHHLEHLADADDDPPRKTIAIGNSKFVYLDEKSKKCHEKLVMIVKRYDEVIWMTKEVESILNLPMLIQFLTSAINVCTIVYRLTFLPFHTEFFYLLVYLNCLIFELWIFCYYGTLLHHESNQVNKSLYLSDWVSLSPRFRRQLLIVMERWSQPILPLAAKLVPLSLNTFVSVLRGSYTMYTILKETDVK